GAARSVGNTPERSCRPGYRGGVRPTAPRALRDSGIRLLATDFTVRVQPMTKDTQRSEEHTSELQSLTNLVCRLLLEKKKEVAFLGRCKFKDSAGAPECVYMVPLTAFATSTLAAVCVIHYRPRCRSLAAIIFSSRPL